MYQFVGRNREISYFNEHLKNNKFCFLALFGRRRVGKTELIKEVMKRTKIKSIYYFCRPMSDEANALALSLVLKQIFKKEAVPTFIRLEEALRFIFEKSHKEKLFLILDEYPNLREKIEGIDAILQNLVDTYQNDSKLKIVISGSYVKTMEETFSYGNPLFGRIHSSLKLNPFDYYEASAFYSWASLEEKISYYSCLGGLPIINLNIDPHKSFEENIKSIFLSSTFYGAGGIFPLIKGEYEKIPNAEILMNIIAAGTHKFTDIKSKFKNAILTGNIDYALNQLIDMGIIEKINPINLSDKKHSFYYLKDQSCLFYYKFIYPYVSLIDNMNENQFFDFFIKESLFHDYIPHQFEMISKEFLIRRNKHKLINPPFLKIGKYFYNDRKRRKNGEFDVVTQDQNGYISYECKFTDELINKDVVLEEEKQIAEAGIPFYKLGFVSKSGFPKELEKKGLILYSLKDFYSEELRD